MWCNSRDVHILDIYLGLLIDKMYDETNHKELQRLFFNTLFSVIMPFNENRISKESNNNGNQGSEGLVQDSEIKNN